MSWAPTREAGRWTTGHPDGILWNVLRDPFQSPWSNRKAARLWKKAEATSVGGVCVRPPTLADAEGIDATIDDEVRVANGWPEEVKEVQRVLHRRPKDALRQGFFVICDAADRSTVLGCVRLHLVDARAGQVQLGLWLGPSARGRGYSAMAIRAAAQLAFAAGAGKIQLGTAANNHRMLRSFARSGATFEERRPHELPNGEVEDAEWWTLAPPALEAEPF